MPNDFLQQFMAGFQMGQSRNENSRRNQEMQMEAQRQQQAQEQRTAAFQLQQEEFALRKKQLAAEEHASRLAAAKEAFQQRMEASSLQNMAPPTAADVGIPEQGPEFGGPMASEINVPQPTMAMPSAMQGQPDVQMPVPTGRQQQEMELAAQQKKMREVLGLERGKLSLKKEFEANPADDPSAWKQQGDGTYINVLSGQVKGRPDPTKASGPGAVGPDGKPVGGFGTARSEGEKNKVSVAKDAVRNMPKWQTFIKNNSDKFGFYAGRATKATQSGALSPIGIKPDAETATFMAEIGRMSNDMLNALSGAAISPAEFERLKQQIPQLEDHPTVLEAKMAALDDYFKFRLQNYDAPYEGPGWTKSPTAAPSGGGDGWETLPSGAKRRKVR